MACGPRSRCFVGLLDSGQRTGLILLSVYLSCRAALLFIAAAVAWAILVVFSCLQCPRACNYNQPLAFCCLRWDCQSVNALWRARRPDCRKAAGRLLFSALKVLAAEPRSCCLRKARVLAVPFAACPVPFRLVHGWW